MGDDVRLAVVERDSAIQLDMIKTVDMKHELHRDKVHERLNDTHKLYNVLRADTFKAITENTKEISNIKQNVQNIDKIFEKFTVEMKRFVSTMTDSVNKVEQAIDRRKTRNEVWKDIGVFILKLGSFAVTIIIVSKYIEKL